MIKNLIFDFGNVLVRHDLRPMLTRFWGDDAEKVQQSIALLSDENFVDDCDRGVKPFEQIIKEKQQQYPDFAEMLQYYADNSVDEITGEVEGMRMLLTSLKQKGYGLYGLTNWGHDIYQVMETYDIFRLLDGQVISSEEQIIKPNRAIYLRLCEKYALRPAECLFTDDKQVNVDGAKSVGMHGIVFVNAEQYAKDLQSFVHD